MRITYPLIFRFKHYFVEWNKLELEIYVEPSIFYRYAYRAANGFAVYESKLVYVYVNVSMRSPWLKAKKEYDSECARSRDKRI